MPPSHFWHNHETKPVDQLDITTNKRRKQCNLHDEYEIWLLEVESEEGTENSRYNDWSELPLPVESQNKNKIK